MENLIKRVISEVRPYSMVPDEGLACTIRLTLEAIDAGIPGDLVECGTWLGGSSFAMLLAQRYRYGEIRRPVWMYDSFQGMAEPNETDGAHAAWWRERSKTSETDPDGFNFCIAPLEKALAAIARFGFGDHVHVRPGWFNETLGPLWQKPQHIAVLRIDCDWYEPCKLVYRELAGLVAVGGPIIVDDYCAWEGCTLATHEYLATNKLPWVIRSAPGGAGMWMIKTPAGW